jgi:hypothetical protein
MFPPFGFSIQECFICYFYCQKTAFVCEFEHTPLWKLMIFSRPHHNVHNILGVDTGATGPRWTVDSMEGMG